MVHYVGSIIGMHSTFTQKGFDQAIKIIKVQCIIVWYVLILELEWRFPHHELMNVLRIIYPQYYFLTILRILFCKSFSIN
jgi:hypothetical protein